MVAWRPPVRGIQEVFHARWADHAYPVHTHDTWTLLIVDDGVIGYDLDRRRGQVASASGVTLLPPHVPHDGHPLTGSGFRKRVVYLDDTYLEPTLVGRAVDTSFFADRPLRRRVSALDVALQQHDVAAAESHLGLVIERLRGHLGRASYRDPVPASAIARLSRERFDADPASPDGVSAAAAALGVSVAHLVRSFSRQYGIPPHRYLIGRRVDLARRLLLDGRDPAAVAIDCGFYDQAHLTRHFRRIVGTSPGRYRRGAASALAG